MMEPSLALALVVLLAAVVIGSACRALTLFEFEVKDGHVTRARGRIPQALLHDLLGACPRGLESKVVIRCRVERGCARLTTQGPLSEETVQQLRNLLGLWPLARLRTAPRIRR